MESYLRSYIDEQFAEAEMNRRNTELKEELYQNLCQRYQDLISEGKDEQAAYNIATATLGDIAPLIHRAPTIAQNMGAAADRRRSAAIVAIAVALYILCPLPLIGFAVYGHPIIGLFLLLGICALATALLIFNHMTRDKNALPSDTTVEEFREWKNQTSESRQMFKAISGAMWSITVAIYLLISFTTHAWHITWIIFVIAAAIEGVIKAVFELRK